ncbi:MAG: ABC transporter substrate-binding protein, partial [Candidatus Rokubacteria bacterium]|nr:ABC transporter substrate-binding protein [Candidatus Rokubacteria bacterium]
EGRFERLPDLAADLVHLKVDVAKDATKTIPIVTAAAWNPVESGLVASLARPRGNITGLTTNAGPEIVGKQLELLKEAVPKVSRVAVLWNPNNRAAGPSLREAEVAARSLRLQLQILEARGPDEFESAFSAMARERAGALLVVTDPMFFLNRTRLADFAIKSRLPAMLGFREYVEAGGLIGYAASLADLWRRAATYVDRILKGAKPADLPMQQPTKFELVLNLKTAKALRLTIPQSVLLRADHVIQ